MKIIVSFFTFFLLTAVCHHPARAFSDEDEGFSMDLAYNLSEQMLYVDVYNVSLDRVGFWLREVDVFVNDKRVAEENLTKKEEPFRFTAEIPVQARPGDTIKVKMGDSFKGDKEREIIVRGAAEAYRHGRLQR